jgi:glycosyltransferase involved in cell wall biosynthesis
MATGAPVVALDASGVRDVLVDRVNGRLVREETPQTLAEAMVWALHHKQELGAAAAKTAQAFSQVACARKALEVYAGGSFSSKRTLHAVSWVQRLLGAG